MPNALRRAPLKSCSLLRSAYTPPNSARRAAEASLREVSARLVAVETEFEQVNARISDSEAQLAIAEERVQAAEMRAANADKAIREIEHAIRTQILGQTKDANARRAAAA